ncbi:Self-incomp_S1 domain-containing protein [Cephalotus follicularis]|uniref:S-protein homolog n=1 Tax=Cephalotus follicularis TaxID=3775 RepID=A0A1Q3D1X7_CEPFO|nr:Self-incomp_S1 domain-containing protein [Cephalotus follicularis]
MNPLTTTLTLHLLVCMSLTATSEAAIKMHRARVVVTNYLNGGLDLTIHCKSKNDDLGVLVLHPHNDFEFSFRPNFWGTTLIYCSMSWDSELHWFDIYIDTRDLNKCNDACRWIVQEQGPCLFNRTSNKYDICYPWNQSSMTMKNIN